MGWLFYPACTAAELPEGTKKRVTVEGYDVCLANAGGTVFACGDICPHEHVSLGDGGTLDGEVLTCGAHRWDFNLRTGECLEDPAFPLRTFPVGRKDGVLYVGFWDDEEDASPVS